MRHKCDGVRQENQYFCLHYAPAKVRRYQLLSLDMRLLCKLSQTSNPHPEKAKTNILNELKVHINVCFHTKYIYILLCILCD